MSVSGTILKRLAALKLPTEAFQEVLAIIGELQAKDDARRERDRKRKPGKSAENPRKIHGNSTPNSAENPGKQKIALSSSSLSREENDQKERKKERKKGALLPADWQPNAQHIREASELGQSYAWVAEQGKDMRLWALANANRAVARKLDWDATFSGWMRRNAKQSRAPPRRENGGGFAKVLEELNNGPATSEVDTGDGRTIDHEPGLF